MMKTSMTIYGLVSPKFAPPIHQDAVMHFQALYTFASCRCRSMPVCILIDSVVSDAVRLVIAVCTVL